jgi:dephospho-CoA kinase
MSTERPRRVRGADRLFIVGVVGRAGSGKSTVARALAADGAEVFDADQIGHDVTDQDPEVRAALVAEYGPDVYRPDGTLDRARVATQVFSDRAARKRLDHLVHPRILARIRERGEELRHADWQGVVVVDAALMLEWGLERGVDKVIAVVAPEAVQVERLMAARGWTADEARRRLAVQRTNEAFAAAADVTLENTGTPDALARAAREAVSRLIAGFDPASGPKGETC